MKKELHFGGVVFFLLALLMSVVQAFALQITPPPDRVVVETKSGEHAVYLLNEQPKLKHNGATVTLITTTLTVEYVASEIERVYLAESPSEATVIEPVMADALQSLRTNYGQVMLSGLQPEEVVSIYTPSGQLVGCYRADGEGSLTIDLCGQPCGISIIKTNHQSFKIYRK